MVVILASLPLSALGDSSTGQLWHPLGRSDQHWHTSGLLSLFHIERPCPSCHVSHPPATVHFGTGAPLKIVQTWQQSLHSEHRFDVIGVASQANVLCHAVVLSWLPLLTLQSLLFVCSFSCLSCFACGPICVCSDAFPRGHDPITHARGARCLAHVGSIFNECCHCHWFIVVTFLKMVSCDGYPVVTCGRTESPRSHGCEFPMQCSFLCAPAFLCDPYSTVSREVCLSSAVLRQTWTHACSTVQRLKCRTRELLVIAVVAQ